MEFSRTSRTPSEDRIVFFSPHSVITPHAELERLLARFFANMSPQVTVIGCDGSFRGGCHPHINSKEEQFLKTCGLCMSARTKLEKTGAYVRKAVRDFLDAEDFHWVESEYAKVLEMPVGSYSKDGIALGKFWLFDIILLRKSADLRDSESMSLYHNAARAGLLAFCLGKKVAAQIRPDAVLVYSFEYGLNRSFASAFIGSKTKVFDTRQNGPLNNRFSQFLVETIDGRTSPSFDSKFREMLRHPLTRPEKSIIWRHARSQIRARTSFSYSSPRGKLTGNQIRKKLDVPEGAKVVGFLLSSPDETVAARSSGLFSSQVPPDRDFFWISEVLALAARRPDVFFVFRLHPRLAPNRRDPVESPELSKILEIIDSRIPSALNIIVNDPWDGVGLYDLALISDCVLSYRTRAADELGLLGIPSIQLEPFRDAFHEPALLDASSADSQNLEELLNSALSAGINGETMRNHARLVATLYSRRNIKLRHSGNPFADRFLALFYKALHKARRVTAGGGLYSGIRFIGDQPISNPGSQNESCLETLNSWMKPSVNGGSAFEEEQAALIWLKKKIRKQLRPFDGSEVFFNQPGMGPESPKLTP